METNESLCRDVAAIRAQSPLVHNITNFVVMNNTANALLALGASPVMAHAEEEAGDMARLAGALVINVVAAGFGLGETATTKGVDSTAGSAAAVAAAQALSEHLHTVVVISGQTDYIVEGNRVLENHYGTPMMSRVTGMGCTATAVCGAFAAVNRDAAQAAFHAMMLMGQCGERALAASSGPGSFQVAFLDALYAY